MFLQQTRENFKGENQEKELLIGHSLEKAKIRFRLNLLNEARIVLYTL